MTEKLTKKAAERHSVALERLKRFVTSSEAQEADWGRREARNDRTAERLALEWALTALPLPTQQGSDT